MKRLIILLGLLILPLWSFTTQDSIPNTVDTVDKDTVFISISARDQSQVSKIDNLQKALTESINNQTSVSESIMGI